MLALANDNHIITAIDNQARRIRHFRFGRHGATKLNNADVSVDRIRGWTDVELSSEGEAEAVKLGEKLKHDPPEIIISSNLKRAEETARIAAKICGAKFVGGIEGFRPWNVGKLTGQLSKKAIPILADYAENKPDEIVAGGESFEDFRARFFQALHDTLVKYPQRLAIVSHHRDERLLWAWKKAGFPKDGEVDIREFNKKGEAPGTMLDIAIPMRWLEATVDWLSMQDKSFEEVMANGADRAKAISDLPHTPPFLSRSYRPLYTNPTSKKM